MACRRNLPVSLVWEDVLEFVGWERRGLNVRIRICLLTNGTSLGQIISISPELTQ